MLLEHVSLSLNPRGTLYRGQGLIEITQSCGNDHASALFQQRLADQPWTVYRVRRIYRAGKDKNGNVSAQTKGSAIRAVERMALNSNQATAIETLRQMTRPTDQVAEQRSIRYVYRERCGDSYPTREELLVAAPSVVDAKARYGFEWFEEQWESSQLTLFARA